MIRSYVKSALRAIRRAKLFSLINIVGLAFGFTAAIMIALWIQNEFSYDKYNVSADRIYRVTSHWVYGNGDYTLPWTAGPLAGALSQLPQVKYAVRLSMPLHDVVLREKENAFDIDNFFYTDPSFFDVFTVKFLEGNPAAALNSANSIVLTRSIAARLFPGRDPIGKSIEVSADVNAATHWQSYTVTGVVEDFPQNSQFHPTSLASYSSIESSDPYLNNWHMVSLYTYFMLRRNSSIQLVEHELPVIVKQYMGKWGEEQKWTLGLERLTDIHLRSHLIGEIEPSGSIGSVFIFGAIGFFVLLISAINFVSLSVARFSDRAKEVGVRKVVGAGRKEVVAQFISEGIVLTFAAGVISISLCELLLPYFSQLTGESLSLSLPDLAFAVAGIFALGTIAAIYPALFLSSFEPNSIFRKEPLFKPPGVPLRKGLVVLQFAIAVGIIASTIITGEQLQYVENKNLGFNKDQVIVIPLRHEELMQKYSTLRQAFIQVPGVKSVSGASGQLGNTNFISIIWSNGKPLFQTRFLAIDYGFLKTMNIKLASGRHFSPDIPSDTSNALLVNEAAADKLRAIGLFDKQLSVGGVYEKARVIGVMENFNYRPLYYPVQPLVVFLQPGATRFMVMRLSSKNIASTVSALRDTWKKVVPDYPLVWRFQDEVFEKAYHSELTLGTLFEIGAFLSIFISLLGLFGLSSYAVEKQIKEIGIRKVLGASSVNIVRLLTKDFILLVGTGGVIGCPIAYYLMEKWLQNFAFKISLTVIPFLLAGGIAVVISAAVIGVRAMKAASANPTELLRCE
jgi:putative ABC transport system permease protein